MGEVKIRGLTICYDGLPVVKDLTLDIKDGEIISLLGPSGAGKTTVLKAVAGLLSPESGEIFINGERVDRLPAEKRDAVMIFQRPLLFPFLDVRSNIGFGLKMIKTAKGLARSKIDHIMSLTGLVGLENRRIHQLSGGQQQRVALARGLVLEPSILLLDEPLSSLDEELRLQMRELIRDVQRHTATTMLFVTHDQSEAFALSDRICLLLDGKLQQVGNPGELFYEPANPLVASFFGCTNLFDGAIINGEFVSSFIRIQVNQAERQMAVAAIRPEDIAIHSRSTAGSVPGKIVRQRFEGSTTRIEILVKDTVVHAVSLRPDFPPGNKVWLTLPAAHFRVFTSGR